MPPKIKRVQWKAENIPYGLEFNEITGIFAGTPKDEGEYIVPVTVETNYGEDTKNVKIIVEPSIPKYSVYAIGTKAKTWNKNAKPDEYGFYGLNIPKMEKLSSWDGGFRAYQTDGDIYGCGTIGSWYAKYTGPYWETTNAPYKIGKYSPSTTPIKCICTKTSLGHLNSVNGTTDVYIFATITEDGHMNINTSVYYTIRINGVTNETYSGKKDNSQIPSGLIVWNACLGTLTGGKLAWLMKDGTHTWFLYYDIDTSKHKATAVTDLVLLGYKAVKFFCDSPFLFLSENMLLNGTATTFTHGVIKDAWGVGNTFYVQTTDNLLYEYAPTSRTWDLLGTYDINKLEVPKENNMLMLTNDGKLYHKGNAVTGLFTTAHTTLTHIFPELTFKDFAFGGNTLTVLKE